MDTCKKRAKEDVIITSQHGYEFFCSLRHKRACNVTNDKDQYTTFNRMNCKTQCLSRKNLKSEYFPRWSRIYPKFAHCSTLRMLQMLLYCLLFLQIINLFPSVEAKSRREVKYHWKAGTWGKCESTSCGDRGKQFRSVNCVHATKNWRVIHSECDNAEKPIDQRSCFKVCAEHRDKYKWTTGVWKECQLIDSARVTEGEEDKCGLDFIQIGSQQRNITCVSVENVTLIMESYVCEKFAPPPFDTRPCDVPCPVNCVTSHWSVWSRCSKSCGNGTQYRTRRVVTNAKYGGSDCAHLSSTRSCPLPRPCDPLLVTFFSKTHVFKFGNWTTCKPGKFELSLSSGNRRKNRKENRRRLSQVHSSLIGGRQRHVTCLNEDGEPLGESLMLHETCTMSRDCDVTKWSEWSNCMATCGKVGNKTRTRVVNHLPTGPGAEYCPSLEEIEQCDIDVNRIKSCNQYTWVTGGWDECKIIDNSTCGGGTQDRDVYCVVRNEVTIYQASTAVALGGRNGLKEWAKLQPVQNDNCEEKYKPTVWQECNILCASMCVVGDWSDWSECSPEKCPSGPSGSYFPEPLKSSRKIHRTGFKRRVRKILDSSNGDDGCPHTTEVIPCDEPSCFRWHPTTVSSCTPVKGRCGEGTQELNIICRDMWGKDVDDSFCARKPAAPTINTTLPCYASCSSDCVIDEWSNWTPCTHLCKRSKRDSRNQTRFREVLANPGPRGKDCPRKDQLQDTRECNQHRCSIYFWDISEWSDCQAKDQVTPIPPAMGIRTSDMFMSDDGNSTGGHYKPLYFPPENKEQICKIGYQTRDVKCRKKDSGLVNDKLCGSRPLISRDCSFPCPKDCVVSEWGEWTDCEQECNKVAKPGQGSSGPVHQVRHRVVVQHRTSRGSPCPIEMKQRRRCMETEKCMKYRWHVSKWSDCVKIVDATTIYTSEETEVKCLGAMTRKVQCRQYAANGDSITVEDRFCFKYADRSPPGSSQHCLIKCKTNKEFENWREKTGCQAIVNEFESYADMHGLLSTTEDEKSYITMQKTAKPIGRWSSCNITKPSLSPLASLLGKKDTEPHCGRGDRQRALACYVEGTDIMVDNSHCQYTKFQQESCEIRCPEDCKLSPWAVWGKCGDSTVGRRGAANSVAIAPPCGENSRMRYRFPRSEPANGGRACPALDSLGLEYETELCNTVCNILFWVPHTWSKCDINRNGAFSNCGEGYQYRDVNCFETDRATGYKNMATLLPDIRSCDLDTMPYGSRSCFSPCPGECVYSEWSTWEACMPSSGTQVENVCVGSRKRTRALLRKVAPETGLPDSHCDNINATTENELCELNTNCFTYSAMWTDWSSCKLSSSAKCGTGKRERRSNCISSSGLPVHIDRCLANNVEVSQPEQETCQVICPIDCELSEWSSWTRCGSPCEGIVERKRIRNVIRDPSTLGRPCPVTVETTPCPPRPCHRWKLGDWSECKIPGGNCGSGLQIRKVKCEQHDGVLVGINLCQKQQDNIDKWFGDSQLRKDCQVTCAGECHMTEWSEWSECHLRCLNRTTSVAGATGGVQTRSRVGFIVGQVNEGDCPSQQTEERSCSMDDAKCFFYKWKTTAKFYKGKRPVWCERTIDGLNVSSGCHDRLKPQEELYCTQDCDTISYAYCGDNGVCECDTGYRENVLSTGILISCDETQPNDDADAVQVVKAKVEEFPDERSVVRKVPTNREIPTTTSSTTTETPSVFESTDEILIKKSGFLNDLGLLTDTGELKVWVYGLIAGLAIFILSLIALIYLICVSCCCKKKQPKSYGPYSSRNINSRPSSSRRKRRHNSSGSNVGVGMVIGMGTPRFPPSNSAMSHTSSTSRSGYHPDPYDDILWKES